MLAGPAEAIGNRFRIDCNFAPAALESRSSPHSRSATAMDAPDSIALTREALLASGRNDAETAIGLLKRAIEADSAAAVPRYLLGAEYAQLGMLPKAAEAM